MVLQPPTSRLPPIRQISSYPVEDLFESLAYLRHIYNPEVRGARRSQLRLVMEPCTGLKPAVDEIDELRSDTFERTYAIRWLTTLVAQISDSNSFIASIDDRERLVQDAASLLAICSGTAAAGVIIRDFVFDRPAGEQPLKVKVKDAPLDNGDYGSVGAQTWGGACVLAETILDDPTYFGLYHGNRDLRILELGAGTGLVSLTIRKLLEEPALSNTTATIVATDYYPSVLENLESNIQTNFPSTSGCRTARLSSHFLDWSSFVDEPTNDPVFDAPFDVVLGADIIYESQHALWIKSCLHKLLRKPSDGHDPLFHLIIPLRSTHSVESSSVDTVFSSTVEGDHITGKELNMRIVATEIILCDPGNGHGRGQIEYAYYKIGWR